MTILKEEIIISVMEGATIYDFSSRVGIGFSKQQALEDSQTILQTSSTAGNQGQAVQRFYIRGRKIEISYPSEKRVLRKRRMRRKQDSTKTPEADQQ